jgi:NhaA family Na+:H+ antiporter
MSEHRAYRLDRSVDLQRDHILGNPAAPMTLVEYGSYTCTHCHAAHRVIAALRDRFGGEMRYVFRHLPITAPREDAVRAARFAEFAGRTTDRFWPVHDALMLHPPAFSDADFEEIATGFDLPPRDAAHEAEWQSAVARVAEDADSGARSGARVTPTFFINGRRYEGAWDESALAEAMLGSLGHRLHAASLDFAQWAPATGVLLVLMSVLAIVLTNSTAGPSFESMWTIPFGIHVGGRDFTLPVIEWINDGLLAVFFLVVGLEIKREFTVGRLATPRAAALPIAAAIGGMTLPALIYLAIIGGGPLSHGWGMVIATDTAFAVALLVLLGDRVSVDLRVFLTAAVIVDDLVAILVVALFYSGAIDGGYLAASAVLTGVLLAINRSGIYSPLPYAVAGLLLWVCLHHAGLHATLAGVILAVLTPTRPPANVQALMTQAELVIQSETRHAGDDVMRHGLSTASLRTLDAIHDRLESPAGKLLRSIEPWSSFAVLPLFAFANAGVVWSTEVVAGHGRLMAAIVLGLALGKPLGMVLCGRLAVRLGLAVKPDAYNWRHLGGAGALAGIGFTMSLFIAHEAFPAAGDFAAAKIGIFIASITAACAGVAILWRRAAPGEAADITPGAAAGQPAQ